MLGALDESALDTKTIARGLHVFANEVVDALDHHEKARTPWGGTTGEEYP